jgi:4'-phosphopantetheinyl transferase
VSTESNQAFLRLQVARVEHILADLPSALATWLSESEQTRLQRLKVANRRHQFLSGHWLVRRLLSQQLGKPPSVWQLIERTNLPPAVLGFADVQVSLSHSGDWIAAAISSAAIGIDLEQRRDRDGLLRFQHLLLAQDEAPDSLDLDQLLQRWVAKEAWIKRQHGSALPEQLAELKRLPASPESATVQLRSTAAFHLAITAQAEPALWHVDLAGSAVLQRAYWRR